MNARIGSHRHLEFWIKAMCVWRSINSILVPALRKQLADLYCTLAEKMAESCSTTAYNCLCNICLSRHRSKHSRIFWAFSGKTHTWVRIFNLGRWHSFLVQEKISQEEKKFTFISSYIAPATSIVQARRWLNVCWLRFISRRTERKLFKW
jgi:hypothetical protein